ncbi:Sperm acrosomal protein-1-like 3, partial [Homarus americanus]
RPADEEVTLRRPVDEEVTLRRPADEEVTLRRPADEEVTLRRPADEEVTLRRPVDEEVTLRRPAAEEVTLRRPAAEEVTLRPAAEEVTLRRPAAEEVTLRRPVGEEFLPLKQIINEEPIVNFRNGEFQDCGLTSEHSSTTETRPTFAETHSAPTNSMTKESVTGTQPKPDEDTAVSLPGPAGEDEPNSMTPIAMKTNAEANSGRAADEGGEFVTLRNHELEKVNVTDFSLDEIEHKAPVTLRTGSLTNNREVLSTNECKRKYRKVIQPAKPARSKRTADKSLPGRANDKTCQRTPGDDENCRFQKLSPCESQNKGVLNVPLEMTPGCETTKATRPSPQDDEKQVSDMNRILASLSELEDNSSQPINHQCEDIRSSKASQAVDDLRVLHKPPIQSTTDRSTLGSPGSLTQFNKIGGYPKKRVTAPAPPNSGTNTPLTSDPHNYSSQDNAPNKPPRESLNEQYLRSLELDQDPCPEHRAALNFYCTKCRMVICRDCTVVAHQQQEAHRVLDTPDALATLRTEAVTLLRHYSLIKSIHDMLNQIYYKYIKYSSPNYKNESITSRLRLVDGEFLERVVKEAEIVVATGRNLKTVRELVKKWEEHQHDWDDLVFLSLRNTLLTNFTAAKDKVYLRLGDWVMPTPWVHLSHLLQHCLGDSAPPSRHVLQVLPSTRSKSPTPGSGMSCGGATDLVFPRNARHVVLSDLIPYIILNPDIRYFIQISDHNDLDVTLIVVPAKEHSQDYLKNRLRNATKSPASLRKVGYAPAEDSFTLVEKQMMMGGRCKTRLIASYMPSSTSGTSFQKVVKVSFRDVKVVDGGLGLPAAKGGVKRGDVVVDQDSNGYPVLCVAVRDVGDIPALRLGRVTYGLDGLTCLVEAEDTKRTENTGFRKKILATVRREEEAVYQVTFGIDL